MRCCSRTSSSRRAEPAPREDDVLGMLMAARDEQGRGLDDDLLRDQLLTLLNAGHDTVTAAMCWAVHHLHRHPAALQRAQEEARAAPDDPMAWAKLPWLSACCAEALRVVPIIPSVGRALAEPLELLGHRLPAGVRVMAPCYLSHRDPELWEAPTSFRPARFLGARPIPYVYYPFGGGARLCIGGAFASMERNILLAALLRETDMTLCEPDAPPARVSLTLIPRGGVDVCFRKRA
ncbi:MAG: cytochrome P450 [Myxococcota bacterium]|jgi:cytochrome P450